MGRAKFCVAQSGDASEPIGSAGEGAGADSRDKDWLQSMLQQHQIAMGAGGLSASDMMSAVSNVLCSAASVDAIQVGVAILDARSDECTF